MEKQTEKKSTNISIWARNGIQLQLTKLGERRDSKDELSAKGRQREEKRWVKGLTYRFRNETNSILKTS
jgi:hypothetical protein